MSIAFSFVFACAVCGAGEKTLPTNGAEVAFAGRKRATLELRAASFETTDRALRVAELRAEPGLAMALGPSTILAADVPVLRRSLALEGTHAPSATSATIPGDAELRVAHTAWKSAPALVTQRLTISAGTKLPTAPLEHDPSGALVPPDLQPGCGSIVPIVGLSYAWTSSLWSAWTSASLLFPVEVRSGSHPGDSLRASFTLQLQPARVLATRLGVFGRLDSTGELDGAPVKESGGASVYVAPEIALSPTQDVVISAGAAFPAVQAMRGYHATSPVLLASIGVDF